MKIFIIFLLAVSFSLSLTVIVLVHCGSTWVTQEPTTRTQYNPPDSRHVQPLVGVDAAGNGKQARKHVVRYLGLKLSLKSRSHS